MSESTCLTAQTPLRSFTARRNVSSESGADGREEAVAPPTTTHARPGSLLRSIVQGRGESRPGIRPRSSLPPTYHLGS